MMTEYVLGWFVLTTLGAVYSCVFSGAKMSELHLLTWWLWPVVLILFLLTWPPRRAMKYFKEDLFSR